MTSAIAARKLDSVAAEDFKKLGSWLLLLTPAEIKEVILDSEADKFTRNLAYFIWRAAEQGDWKSFTAIVDRIV